MPTSKKNVYTIVLHNTKKVLGVADPSAENGCPVLLQDADNSVSQQWELISSETGCKLAHKASGRLLDVMQAGTENGSRLQLWEDVNGDSQLWQTEETDAGCKLKSCKSGRCMDAGMEAAAGAPIQLWDDVNGENQLWDLVPVSVRKPAAPKADKPEAPQNS